MAKCQYCGAPLSTRTRDLLVKLHAYFDEMERTCIRDDTDDEDELDLQDWVWSDDQEGILRKEIAELLK